MPVRRLAESISQYEWRHLLEGIDGHFQNHCLSALAHAVYSVLFVPVFLNLFWERHRVLARYKSKAQARAMTRPPYTQFVMLDNLDIHHGMYPHTYRPPDANPYTCTACKN